MKTVLVTGGAGFVGTNLVIKLKSLGYTVFVLDNLSYGKKQNYIDDVIYIEHHTKNIKELNLPNLDLIFHLGEYSKITPSFEEIENVFDLNIVGSFAILEYAKTNNIPIVYAASSTRLAMEGENHSPYSFFKASITQLLKNYSEWYNLKYSICYFYNVYGPYQDTCDTGWETVISIFEKQYKAGSPLTIVGDGTQRRDFTYVGDIVNGLILASEKLCNEEYQLGSGVDYSILEVAEMFSTDIMFIPDRRGDRKYSKADTNNTFDKLGWVPEMTLTKWIDKVKNTINNKDQCDVVIMITAIDRPELHLDVFSKYLEYTKGVNCKWVITVNNVTNRISETETLINTIFKDSDVHVKTFNTGGTRKDWHESAKYCINYAYSVQPKLGYLWLEDDWLYTSDKILLDDLKLLDDDNCYISLHNREHVSFNPGIWSHEAFNELMYNTINNPESSIGATTYKYYYIDRNEYNPERLCCGHPESTNFIKSYKLVPSRFKDVGRKWQSNLTNNFRTFQIFDINERK